MSAEDWLLHVRAINPFAETLFASGDRAEFLNAAECLIERAVDRMEASRATCRKLDEPDLSHFLKELLGELVPAEAEAHQNGHVDVTISHPRGNERHCSKT